MLDRLWFHTSTHDGWPTHSWNPTAAWTPEAFERMERMLGPGATERWAEKQLRKCLHLGTYRAAIENMERRQAKQGDTGSFYLYRVRLATSIKIHPDVITDPGGMVGDVLPEDVMSDDESVVRYVNEHEDRGSISLAVRKGAIAAVQSIPLLPDYSESTLLAALDAAPWRIL